MKKLLFAISMIAAVAAVSCTQVELEPESPIAAGDLVTIGVSLPLDATKTAIGTDGKTVTWALGDSILVTDGTKKVGVPIPEEFVGKKEAKVALSSKDLDFTLPLYAVYPYGAFSSVSNGVVTVKIANEQSGLFNEANICVAKTEDFNFAFKNATAVMKVKLAQPDIETIMISGSSADTLASTLAVTYSAADAPLEVKASAPVKSIKVNASGLDGDYYVAVTPGTYSEELSLMVLTLDGKTETVKSTKPHTLKANDLVYLGEVGNHLEGISFEGTGSDEDPFLIKNIVELNNLATLVNSGLSYEGTSFKLADNIEDAQIPIGKYDAVNYYFCGSFDGDGHTVTLNMGGMESTADRLGLFGAVGPKAYIHDVKVDGLIQTKGAYVGAIAATVNAGTVTAGTGAKFENCVNKATILADSYVGGVSGYVSGAVEFNNCSNEGAVFGIQTISTPTANVKSNVGGIIGNANGSSIRVIGCKNEAPVSSIYNVGGIVGYAYACTIDNCINTAYGEITGSVDGGGIYKMNQGQSGWLWGNFQTAWAGGTPYNINNSLRGVGGIAGCAQNATIKNCVNNADISGVSKVGGISGTAYTSSTASCVNTGAITASETMAGGIIGYVYTSSSSTGDSNSGAVTGKFAVGGLIGHMNTLGFSSSSSTSNVSNGQNTGAVTATAQYEFRWGTVLTKYSCAGGIVGLAVPQGQASARRGYINIKGCENKAAVTGAGAAVGGIVGAMYGTQYSLTNSVVSCVNSGSVTGTYYVGGVVGESYANLSGHSKFVYSNLSNSGTVTATVEEGASYAGGIIGASVYNKSGGSTSYGAHLANSFNTGDVIYTAESSKNPCVGGIIGSTTLGVVYNVYNAGDVTPASGEMPGEDVTSIAGVIGSITGTLATANYLYFKESTVEAAVGTASTVTPAVLSMVDDEDGLYTPATIASAQYDNVINALNAYVTTVPKDALSNSYFTWVAGPAFVK